MHRRVLLLAAAAGSLAAPLGSSRAADPLPPAAPGWRRYETTTRITLLDAPGPAQLWLPLAQSAGGYQSALDLRWTGGGRTEVVRDARYGAPLLRTDWTDEPGPHQLEVVQVIATRDREPAADALVPLTEADRRFWTAPTPSVPTDGIVRATAERITAGHDTPHAKLRALYDWVVDTTWRNPDTPGCGTGDVKGMLESSRFGGKCADINGLMVALARASGFPARDVYGIRVGDSRLAPGLGKTGDVSRAQHCRAEIYLDETGWMPLDPADVRKVVLEGKLPLDHPQVQALRDRLFGAWEMNWVGYNSATDIDLPGQTPIGPPGQTPIGLPGAAGRKPAFAFLMYPCAFTTTGQPDCLDAAHFQYRITARDLAA